MKKAAAIVLALTLSLSMLTACRSNNNGNNTTNQPPTNTSGTTNPVSTTNPAGEVGQGVGDAVGGVVQGAGEVIGGVAMGIAGIVGGIGNEAERLTDVDEAHYQTTYGIDKSKYEEVAIKAGAGETEAREIILIKAKDENNLKEAVADLEARKKALDTTWKNNEQQYKRVQSAIVKTKGNYAVLIVAENAAEAEKAFDSLNL